MEKSLHRKVVIISLVVAVISLLGTGIIIVTKLGFDRTSIIVPVIFGFSMISILTSYAIEYQDKKRIRNIVKYSMFLLAFITVPAVYINVTKGLNTIDIILLVFVVILTLLTLIHLFLYTNAISLIGVIVLLLFIVTGMYFKRNHWPLAGMIMTTFSFLISVGSFMYGIRCLFLADKITYFRNVSFYGSCVLSIAFLGYLFKLQHWAGAGPLVIVGFASQIVVTIYILLTLHSSGFIDWQPFHKKILRRILIPWTFILFLYISLFMVPELNTLIWTPEARKTDRTAPIYGFGMKDYKIENKNGINTE